MSGRILVFSALALLALQGPAARATTWFVTPDGSGDAPTIQAAIDSASSGDVIELADGVYTGYGNRDLSNMEKRILLKSASGNPEACIIDLQGSPTDPHWGISIFEGG